MLVLRANAVPEGVREVVKSGIDGAQVSATSRGRSVGWGCSRGKALIAIKSAQPLVALYIQTAY